VAQAAAIAFVAYIVGSFTQGLASLVVGVLRTVRRHSDVLAVLTPRLSDYKPSWRPDYELHGVAAGVASEALRRLEARGVHLLEALATIDWTRRLGEFTGHSAYPQRRRDAYWQQ